MKNIFLISIALIMTGTSALFAFEIKVTQPVFSGNHPSVLQLNLEAARIFQNIERDIRVQLSGINSNPQKLIGAFANSSVFASDGATQRAYSGFDRFAMTAGSMIGFQLPGSPFSIINELNYLRDTLVTEGDLGIGLNPQVFNAQFGMNTSFLLKNFYLGAKFGLMMLPVNNVTINTLSFGVMGSYQLFSHRSLGLRTILWRGLNLGVGFIYQNSNLSLALNLDTVSENIIADGNNVTLDVQPKLDLIFNIDTLTIPLEVMTSIRLFYFLNLALGVGADIGFGNANLNAGGSVDMHFRGLPDNISYTPANLSVSGLGGDAGPNVINPKVMSGIGFTLGPVLIDIPFTYYPLDHGFNLGITFGVFW